MEEQEASRCFGGLRGKEMPSQECLHGVQVMSWHVPGRFQPGLLPLLFFRCQHYCLHAAKSVLASVHGYPAQGQEQVGIPEEGSN